MFGAHFDGSNPGRVRFGGCGPEQNRFGGRAPELFTDAFEHEGRTLKGNKAQGSIGPTGVRKSVQWQRTLQRSKALRSNVGVVETALECNGEKETIVVTQRGCGKGKRFGGYEVRVRERHGGPTVTAMWLKGDCVRNGSNPMAGYRVQ